MNKLYDKNGNFFAEFYHFKDFFQNYSRHSHETLGFGLVEDGEIEIEFHNKENHYLQPNKISIFNPNQVHKTRMNKNRVVSNYYSLHIDIKWCKNIQSKFLQTDDEFLNLKQNIINEESLYNNLKKVFKKIVEEGENFQEDLENIIINILKKYSSPKKQKIAENKIDRLLEKIEKYILDNINEQISLEELSLEMGYSQSYINKIFKKEYGLTPHAFIVNARVNKAKKDLLNSSNVNLTHLANDIGFYDQSHLSKVFKQSYAISPNRYMNGKISKKDE